MCASGQKDLYNTQSSKASVSRHLMLQQSGVRVTRFAACSDRMHSCKSLKPKALQLHLSLCTTNPRPPDKLGFHAAAELAGGKSNANCVLEDGRRLSGMTDEFDCGKAQRRFTRDLEFQEIVSKKRWKETEREEQTQLMAALHKVGNGPTQVSRNLSYRDVQSRSQPYVRTSALSHL